jgi:hypothetical protein
MAPAPGGPRGSFYGGPAAGPCVSISARSLVLKLPAFKLGPKPTMWDLVALAVLLVAGAAAAANWMEAQGQAPGTSLSGTITLAFVLAQMAIASLSLLVLGKTAKVGTLWGNLAAVGGMLAGLSGVLLATALWIAA